MKGASPSSCNSSPSGQADHSDSSEPIAIEGVYRQIESVLLVDESGEINFDNSDQLKQQQTSNESIERLLLVQKTSLLLWKLVDYSFETAAFDVESSKTQTDIYPYFFCLSCAQRYPCSREFLQHLCMTHRSIHKQLTASHSESLLQSLPTLIIMNNFSLCKGEPSRGETLQFTLQSLASSSPNFEQLIQRNFGSSLDVDMNQVLQHVSMNFLNGIADFSNHINDVDLNSSPNSSSSVAGAVPLVSSTLTVRNSTKTLKCPKCNWHYKYQETLEIHMKEKHSDNEVSCTYCLQGRPHPRLARGETYSCGYKPYRCELCKYSTTTKGNLSIHMQSDKHLHAVQEMPSIASAAGFTDLSNASVVTTEFDHENILQCLVCSSYSTDNLTNMIKHIEKDRSRPIIGDIAVLHGVYHCNLCPYSTNLKANFQLHTRTDKHLQRVQMEDKYSEKETVANVLNEV